jgi:predicted nucleic acid-binding protein
MDLHEVALEIGIAANHSTYDTLYLAFAIAMGARGVLVSDKNFVRDMRAHPDPLVGMLVPLDEWAKSNGIAV